MKLSQNLLHKYCSFVLLGLSLFVFSSCENGEGERLVSFLVGLLVFMIGTMLIGIPAIVFSAIGIKSEKPAIPILAIVFNALYLVFFFIEVDLFLGAIEQDGVVMVFPLINLAIVAMCTVFIVMGFKNRKKGFATDADKNQDVLDDIINGEEEEIL